MTKFQSAALALLRIILGWLFLYAGISHLRDAKFAAVTAGYLGNAKLFTGFYHWLASPSLVGGVAALNAWALTLIGIALILGIFTKWAAYAGVLMMALYYLPLGVIHPDAHSLIVDDHIIYIAGLLVLAACNAGRSWGLDGFQSS